MTKRFAETVAVDDLTLSIEQGRLLRHARAVRLRQDDDAADDRRASRSPTAGTVTLGGQDVTDLPPYKRDVNTVFQSYALFPHLTVEKNVAFGLERRKVDKAEVTRQVGEMLELVQLGAYGKRKPGQLSGGQQQRVALARALVNHPRALLLDEPLGALDLRLRKQLQIELKRIQQEVGITFVHVTHDQEEAMTMADEIAVMNEGRIEQAGDATTLYERPRTAFVAKFLGVSNLIDGRATRRRRLRDPRRGHAPRPGRRSSRRPNGDAAPGGRAARRRSRSAAAALRRPGRRQLASAARSRSPPSSASSIQYLVRTPGGEELTVVEQNTGGRASAAPSAPARTCC